MSWTCPICNEEQKPKDGWCLYCDGDSEAYDDKNHEDDMETMLMSVSPDEWSNLLKESIDQEEE